MFYHLLTFTDNISNVFSACPFRSASVLCSGGVLNMLPSH